MFSDHNMIKLEINYRKIEKSLNTWRFTKLLLTNPCFKDIASREIKYYFERNENRTRAHQNCEAKLKQHLEENI